MTTKPVVTAEVQHHLKDAVLDELQDSAQVEGLPAARLMLIAQYAVKAVLGGLTIHSVHALEALPAGAVVIDRDGDPWKKNGAGFWVGDATVHRAAGTETSLQLEAWAPLFVVPTTVETL